MIFRRGKREAPDGFQLFFDSSGEGEKNPLFRGKKRHKALHIRGGGRAVLAPRRKIVRLSGLLRTLGGEGAHLFGGRKGRKTFCLP